MAKKAYQCGNCEKVHEYHFEAERCCQPEVWDCWICPVCDQAHQEEADAITCCEAQVEPDNQVSCPYCLRLHGEARHVYEVQVAGHCSVCNPTYTIDEKIQIADLLERRAEEHAHRCRLT